MAWNIGGVYHSYDYSDMIEELRADKAEGLIGSHLYIERGKPVEGLPGYRPVIDYYYDPTPGTERVSYEDLLHELTGLNGPVNYEPETE